ncbi:MAG: right-handed parallel beta-helix repeat-containing protein [Candidatus Helarchaeota archaeon]|nr:right-handed parallel beta-helix repeat-containing protein [Candidatus Helarchaeota archaeon]
MNRRKLVVGISCVFLFLIFSLSSMVDIHPVTSPLAKAGLQIKFDPPIWINNNADLKNAASSGNGTQGFPYIIENYVINSSASAHGIQISNTNVYFIIRNCTINQTMIGGGGIRLHHVLYGQVVNNTVLNAYAGIDLEYSNYTNIYNNSITNGHDGMQVYFCNRISIYNNSICYNSYAGINFWGTSNTTISFNSINHSSIGMIFYQCYYNNVTFNSFFGNPKCIQAGLCEGNYYFGNTCGMTQIPSFTWMFAIIGIFLGTSILLVLQMIKKPKILIHNGI